MGNTIIGERKFTTKVTKRSQAQFTVALAQELAGEGLDPNSY